MSKLLVSIAAMLVGLHCWAQKNDSTDLFVMPGIVVMPFSLGKGYSSAVYYSAQFGSCKFPVKGVIGFGFPSFDNKLEGGMDIDYTISGAFIKPGLLIYFDDISKKKDLFYIGFMGYFGKYNHQMKFVVSDTNWGTSQPYSFEANHKINGFSFETGGLFTIYKRLKGTASLNFGKVWLPDNPMPPVTNFRNTVDFMPGMGTGLEVTVGFNLGIHYLIN